jgi:AcrR family transcriptional regulator
MMPRKSPRQTRSEATVAAILGATARILVREGWDRASTNRIAEVAGVSVGSLYQYFPSKEALVAALMDRHVDEASALLWAAADRLMGATLEVAVRGIVQLMIDVHRVDPLLHKVLHEEVPRGPQRERYAALEERALTLARAFLETHRAELRDMDLDLAALIVAGTIESLTHGAVIHRPDLLADARLVDEISTLVLRYLRP